MRRRLSSCLLLVALAALVACEKPHVLVVGLDGANWAVVDPLIDAGLLPNMGRLIRNGASAGLLCAPADPATACFCPPVWTSLATGVPLTDHRIFGFFTPSGQRGVKAIWNVVAEHGGIATTVSYRGTWPPEAGIDFVMTEPGLNSAADAHFDVWPGVLDHPAYDEDEPLFQPTDILETLGFEPPAEPVTPVWTILGRDRIAMEAALRLSLARGVPEPWDRKTELTMVLLHSADKVAHLNWNLVQDAMYAPFDTGRLLEQSASWRGPVTAPGPFGWGPIAGPYLEADAWLGKMLAAHPFDYVVFMSDHGMTRNPGPGLPGHHNQASLEAHTGIFAVHGPGVRPGEWLGDVSVLDVTPTLAYLLQLPIAEDLPGRVLSEGFFQTHLDLHPPGSKTVRTWE